METWENWPRPFAGGWAEGLRGRELEMVGTAKNYIPVLTHCDHPDPPQGALENHDSEIVNPHYNKVYANGAAPTSTLRVSRCQSRDATSACRLRLW